VTRIEPADPSFDPAHWGEGDAGRHLAQGVELFNAARYEAAHEEFEQLWLSTQGPDSGGYSATDSAVFSFIDRQ